MTPRRGWIFCFLVCLGCQVAIPSNQRGDSYSSPADQVPSLDAPHEPPAGFFDPPLALQAQPKGSHLSQAVAYLSEGNRSAACQELDLYLTEHPDHFEIRTHRAELLLGLGKVAEAEQEFARVIADAQEVGEVSLALRVSCHRALKDIAEIQNDDYSWHFHRGVGLYLLAVQRAKLPDPDGTLPMEGLLFKATHELMQAHALRRNDARPCWYLHQAWGALGQQAQSIKWLQRALAAAPFSSLTPAEQRGLALVPRTFAKNLTAP